MLGPQIEINSRSYRGECDSQPQPFKFPKTLTPLSETAYRKADVGSVSVSYHHLDNVYPFQYRCVVSHFGSKLTWIIGLRTNKDLYELTSRVESLLGQFDPETKTESVLSQATKLATLIQEYQYEG